MVIDHEAFDEGYNEGFLIGQLKVIINVLNWKDDKADEMGARLVREGVFTEFMHQQALFYVRIGIHTYNGRKH